MESGFLALAGVVLIATILGIIARAFKQPLILAFIFTGVIINYAGFLHLTSSETLQVLSDMGIMFLLFLVGLEIDFKSLKLIGPSSLIIGLAQIISTAGLGFLISHLLHFPLLQSGYIAAGLTFSSTIIVVKLLSEKRDSTSLYGKISISMLLVQDFVAILILVLLSGIESGSGIVLSKLIFTILKAIVLFGLTLAIGKKLIPFIFDRIAKSQELLFFASLSWAFIVAAIISYPKIGFPVEVGGLLAGLALANSSEQFQIFSKIKYIRDFFVLIFFVILGSSMVFSNFSHIITPLIVLSIFVLIIKPILVMLIMLALGYRSKTSFMAGLTISQTSEFSLVLASLGMKLGHINSDVASLMTGVSIISIAISTYLIIYADSIYKIISPILNLLQKKKIKEQITNDGEFAKPIILIGSHRLGQSIIYNLNKEDVLVIDFDPQIINQLKKHNYNYLFGDITDEEILRRAHFKDAALIISTVPDIKDNFHLLQEIHRLKKKGCQAKVIIRAEDEDEMKSLYEKGADYVIFPHLTSGQYLGKSISIDPQMNILGDLKDWDLKMIEKLNHSI